MKKTLLLTTLGLIGYFPTVTSQCTTNNAASCVCDDASNDCDLLPDITISWYALENVTGGPTEDPGRIYVSGSTPNIGHGPFTVRGVDMNGDTWFKCGQDTFSTNNPNNFVCPGGETPQQLVWQRIYHKNGNVMSDYLRMATVAMTYHPNHAHNHFDNWGKFSLRMKDASITDPRNWPIVGVGHKLGFCLMDYYSCTSGSANHHCKDDNTVYNQGTTLNQQSDFPNFGLGGGSYNCSMTEEGISAGYTDLYGEWLDGMWIDVPPNTCNGDYWIVYEVDPDDAIKEENEDNNYTAMPITLTNQNTSAPPFATISSNSGQTAICAGDMATLTANGGLSYLWSNGDTTSTITVGAGTYSCQVTTYCGTATSPTMTITELPVPATPTTQGDTICVGQAATLTATGNNVVWYNNNGDEVGNGNTFTTPSLTASQTYFVADIDVAPGYLTHVGALDNSGSGSMHSGGQALVFNVMKKLTLKSVKVYADGADTRTFELWDAVGGLVHTTTVMVPDGESRVTLNWEIPMGNDYEMTINNDGVTDLFRNNAGVNYPYEIADTIAITGSTAGSNYYYYFYDWELEFGGGQCGSALTPVVATVEICSAVEEVDLAESIFVYPNPSNGNFWVELIINGTTNIDLTLHDLAGRVLYIDYVVPSNKRYLKQISVGTLPKGIYILSFNIHGKVYHKRIALQ